MPERFDVVVVGGGTAGLVTASGCARMGRRVALIDKATLGGDCLWTGCVPTKALVASAKLLHQMRHADAFGLEPQTQAVSPRRIMDSMRAAQAVTAKHDDPEKFRNLGIDVISGQATLLGDRRVEVNGRTLEAKDVVIATGSRTSVPPVEGLKQSGFLDHVSFLQTNELPRSILILGGGSIGIEFAQLFRRFGVEVTVVEMADEIAAREDHEVIATLREILAGEGIAIRTGWSVKAVRTDGKRKTATIENKSGSRETVTSDEIFVASGRRGNIEDLGLDKAGVKVEKSYVVVDKYLQTTAPRIWACGDVHGHLQFTHVAAYEAVRLVRNMLFPGKSPVTYDHVPWGLFTDPEVGHIGMTEKEAVAERGRDGVRTYSVPMADVDRAVVDRTTAGFVKFVCDRKGNILGAHAICSGASTLIEEIVLARKKNVRIGELAQLVSPYPSLADAIQKAASLYYQDLGTSRLGQLAKRLASWSQ
jgi:pyruvate/2-oxoglutarate dehydrogenase complex dihydrolipoamide dehydrogenase (E3) component